MASGEQHLEKYEFNRELLKNEMSVQNTKHYDWIVTIAFYSALHLIEMEIFNSEEISREHTDNHKQRTKIIKDCCEFKNIEAAYQQLNTRSWHARYTGFHTNEKHAKRMMQNLEIIENELLKGEAI